MTQAAHTSIACSERGQSHKCEAAAHELWCGLPSKHFIDSTRQHLARMKTVLKLMLTAVCVSSAKSLAWC